MDDSYNTPPRGDTGRGGRADEKEEAGNRILCFSPMLTEACGTYLSGYQIRSHSSTEPTTQACQASQATVLPIAEERQKRKPAMLPLQR